MNFVRRNWQLFVVAVLIAAGQAIMPARGVQPANGPRRLDCVTIEIESFAGSVKPRYSSIVPVVTSAVGGRKIQWREVDSGCDVVTLAVGTSHIYTPPGFGVPMVAREFGP